MPLILKDGFVVQEKVRQANLIIDDGIIADISETAPTDALIADSTVIDCSGLYILPGLIDMHVHLREPGYEYKEDIQSASRAAAYGGVTTICSMANTNPPVDNSSIVSWIKNRSREIGLCDVLPYAALTKGMKGEELTEIGDILSAGACGFSDDGFPISSSEVMRRGLEYTRFFNSFIACHEEDRELFNNASMHEGKISAQCGIRSAPAEAESVMVARDIELARLTGGRVHFCHISSKHSVELIRRAKEAGLNITAEVTPNHLSLTDEICQDYDSFAKVNPPLREESDRLALLEAVKSGVIDCIASDHAPHHIDDKLKEFDCAAFGMIGLQLIIPLLTHFVEEGFIDWCEFAKITAANPAKILNLNDRGVLRKGLAADIAVIDPKSEYIFDESVNASKSYNTPFWKKKLRGRAVYTIKGGKAAAKV
ncbi:MAG: dihydroorotase [Deferribacteraceae bacterium]|jgi:dihydroorotase|nr:dihydroorotase [Deferribacteraceae bacterium]